MKTFEKACTDLGFKSEELESKRARLFPLSNLKLTDEVNTTSILLSSLCAIKEFREAIFKEIGIGTITNKTVKLHAYTEILPGKEKDRPDGLIFLATGKAQNVDYSFFFEVKTKGTLEKAQIEKYLQKAKDCKIDYLITISNAFVTTPEMTPIPDLKNRKNLFHFSWKFLATILYNVIYNGIADEDQVFIAKELLTFLDNHPDIQNFNRMHDSWNNDARDILNTNIGKFTPKTKFNDILNKVCLSWIQEEKDICLKLQKEYNKQLSLNLLVDEKSSLNKRIENYRKTIEATKILESKYLVNCLSSKYFASVKDRFFNICLNFNSREVKNELNLPAFKGKKNQGQISELLRLFDKLQVGEEDKIFIEPIIKGNRSLGKVSYKELKERKDFNSKPYELFDSNLINKDDIKHFCISATKEIDSASFYSPTKVIEQIDMLTMAFFKNIVNQLCL